MFRRLPMVALALLIAAPLAGQVSGLEMRVDRSTNASDPDDVPDVTLEAVGSGFQITTGPAVIVWNPANSATGAYNLAATFTLQAPSAHNNYYGLFYGGGALDGERQNYMYFLIGQNGSYIVKHRANNETIHDVQGRTPSEAVVKPGANGKSINKLEVRVGAEQTQFVINGAVVFTAPKTGMAGRTDGLYGVRVNHVIPGVLVEGLAVTR